MTLTPEQQERIRINRARALAIQKERREKEQKEKKKRILESTTKNDKEEGKESKKQKKMEDLEEFEVGASEWITKTEAMKMYCVPEGTLAVCHVEEKENPHHKSWKPMKLYRRSEVRERAHNRYGGMEGLQAERNKRQKQKFARDVEMAKSIFDS